MQFVSRRARSWILPFRSIAVTQCDGADTGNFHLVEATHPETPIWWGQPMSISCPSRQVHQRRLLLWQWRAHALAGRALAGLRSRYVLAVLGSCLTAGGLAFAQGGPAPPPPVTVAKPVVKDIVEQTDFIGRFEAVDQVDIRARVSGYLDKVHFPAQRTFLRPISGFYLNDSKTH